MDTRRLLTTVAALTLLSGCAVLKAERPPVALPVPPLEVLSPPPVLNRVEDIVVPPSPISDAGTSTSPAPELPASAAGSRREAAPPLTGRRAIAVANSAARTASVSDGFVGGVQVFAWAPGRVFEVWTAPLRVTTLTLGPGETLVSKASGDTVRWQIGEAMSGEGAALRVHVMLKPLERGLETNLVLTTNRRVYLIDLRSGAADAFNTAVAWDDPDPGLVPAAVGRDDAGSEPIAVVTPQGPLDGRYRIEARGRRPRWTPTSVFNDGMRTFITFDADMQVDEAPALFVISPQGEAQMVNYRQVGGLFVVDRLFDLAELRLGDRRPQVVRLRRLSGAPR